MGFKGKFNDEELIESLKSGIKRNEAIGFLYDNYFNTLSTYVINNRGTQEDAEDIFQEVLVNFIALVQAGKFRGESSIKTFLFSMNKFKWLNELKRRNNALGRETGFEKNKETIEFNNLNLFEKDVTTQVKELLEKLGEQCRKILVMFYYDNFSMKEILDKLGYENEQVVRNKKYKCLKQLSVMVNENPALQHNLKTTFNG